MTTPSLENLVNLTAYIAAKGQSHPVDISRNMLKLYRLAKSLDKKHDERLTTKARQLGEEIGVQVWGSSPLMFVIDGKEVGL